MSKASSRIPTFCPKSSTPIKQKPSEITPKDIGRKVRVGEKEGTLRYVGNVHFTDGVWCGVELSASLGKNDGFVNGVRYFACPQNCGLMAPLSKVSLLEGYDNVEDGFSGPYSMLFIDEQSETFVVDPAEKPQENRRRTFSKEKPTTLNLTRVVNTDKNDDNKSNELGVEIKRRKTSKILNSVEKLSSQTNQFEFGTPLNKFGEFEDTLLKKLQTHALEDDGSKRDSLEFEESLGILTPEQMIDGSNFTSGTPSSECIREFKDKPSETELQSPAKSDLPSPNIVTDFSLGIIDEHLISNLTLKTDTTMNMELPLDTTPKSKDFILTRLEQTPSPEDLPLDPTPIVESDSKTEPSKSKTSSSFITSITSITSLDTGYQGDGEMSRPASRGPDNSPLTRRPLPRPQTRRPDPMTDSDFYTESDADNHEENPLRGDRRAQVIDGTLYGVDPQAAADIYVNNRENMDSSGIFTDIESNTRNEEDPQGPINTDVSPSDTSTNTISGNSQDNIQKILEKSVTNKDEKEKTTLKDNPKKRNASSPITPSPSSVRSPRHIKEENASKKFKLPKREVTSKVKAMMESGPTGNDKKIVKKPVGRWDAVMNKISKTETTPNLKDVKSKVFNSVKVASVQRQTDVRKSAVRQTLGQKTPNTKLRRVRARTGSTATPKSNVESSIHSSFSDLSASGAPPKAAAGSSKKREVVQVTQVLTPSKLSPRPTSQNAENKKTPTTTSLSENKTKRIPSGLKDKKQPSIKDCGRATVKGGGTSPAVRPPVHTRAPTKPIPKVAEALAVLVQHLVFNVEAYQVPVLKKQVQKLRNEAEELRLACQRLEQTLAEERVEKNRLVDEERAKCAEEINKLLEEHRIIIIELNNKETRLVKEHEAKKLNLAKQNEEKLLTLKQEFQKLQKTHEESLDILREENDSIREQIDEKNAQIEEVKHESRKLKEDYEAKETKLQEQLQNVKSENLKLKQELGKIEERFEEKLNAMNEENLRYREENERLLSYSNIEDTETSFQELQSLRVVLELKQKELADLRRAWVEADQKNKILAADAEKYVVFSARCEDLQLQLERKNEVEQNLIAENKKLSDNLKEEINQNKRLCRYNEELKWKLNQNKEIVSKVLEHTGEESNFSRSLLTSSFNERHISPNRLNFERTLSFRESWKSKNDDLSPPSSPKVKGVVEKSDSVSYVLDLDESPEIIASRLVRRSFRNSTPPKTTPTKSPSNRRPRMKFPLSLSASASAILPSNKNEYSRSHSLSSRNGECNGEVSWATSVPKRPDEDLDFELDEDDLKLPALPSEIGRKNGVQALPSPKHLAGEAMISESNSEDESTSSSSVQL